MFVSPHRRRTSRPGHGIQYLPGHVEPFVDLVLERFVPRSGRIVDLGGGGLRFALPVALSGRQISVVDLDPLGLDLDVIVDRVNANDESDLSSRSLADLIEVHVGDGLEFLEQSRQEFALITAFRLVHLFPPELLRSFFGAAYHALEPAGHLVVSAMTAYNLPLEDPARFNEVFASSEPVRSVEPLYRRFVQTRAAAEVRRTHNLSGRFHLVDAPFVSGIARAHGFEVVVDSYKSTRIVAGFVLRRPSAC